MTAIKKRRVLSPQLWIDKIGAVDLLATGLDLLAVDLIHAFKRSEKEEVTLIFERSQAEELVTRLAQFLKEQSQAPI
jgi:hypothetical protein